MKQLLNIASLIIITSCAYALGCMKNFDFEELLNSASLGNDIQYPYRVSFFPNKDKLAQPLSVFLQPSNENGLKQNFEWITEIRDFADKATTTVKYDLEDRKLVVLTYYDKELRRYKENSSIGIGFELEDKCWKSNGISFYM